MTGNGNSSTRMVSYQSSLAIIACACLLRSCMALTIPSHEHDKRSIDASAHSPPIDMDRARFDKDLASEKKNQITFIQSLLVKLLQPKPIIDTISEDEKYGNEGESFGKIGRGIVGGIESLTTLLSSAVDLPFETLKSVSRKATATLANIGTKIVGL